MKKTSLYPIHLEKGAKMVPFAGYEMPIRFSGIIEEHFAIREKVGVFDVSHMGEFRVKGAGATVYIEKLIPNSLLNRPDGAIAYTQICKEDGGILDDLLVYKFNSDHFFVVVNASNIEKDLKWFQNYLPASGVSLTDESERVSLIAIQGPLSQKVLENLFPETDFQSLKYYHFLTQTGHGDFSLNSESGMIISRTGYTGEDGFEIYIPNERAPELYKKILETSVDATQVVPCGLGCRDSLRMEAGMCLYGQDLSENINPIQAGLKWTVKLKKPDFIGKKALTQYLETLNSSGGDILMGVQFEGNDIPRGGYPLFFQGEKVGQVTSGGPSPYLKGNIAMAYLPNKIPIGEPIEMEIRNRKAIGKVVPLPFYKRIKK